MTDGRYCDTHRAAAEASRRPEVRSLYGEKWRRASAAFVRGKACICGCGQPATVTDHVRPHKGDPVLFWDRANWQPMAKRCHDRKTGGGDRAVARPAVKGCGPDGTPLDPGHPWNRTRPGRECVPAATPTPAPARRGRGGAKV
ncbi:HNH endonuclease [Azospirillum doebereinerae]|uniref:HNH endonuclease signature motif containing protein n=1 Tax=Azospirillum doebereinerae TaxID=92933 RepID=UPI001EE62105|nr:HNH endonuclease signature motif containing protein [Azospirillum doebereinerae]MCG5239538.1 HNH endonuclease [Azospirillum doebereinerae]